MPTHSGTKQRKDWKCMNDKIEQEYVTVPCRVPAGLLKDGETLEYRRPKRFERFLSTVASNPVIDGVCCDNEIRPVIIPPFDANTWAARNLPKLTCEKEVWAAIAGCGWMIWTKEPVRKEANNWYCFGKDSWDQWHIEGLLGSDEFKLPWQQSKFKWCEHWSDDGTTKEWRWVWQGGKA